MRKMEKANKTIQILSGELLPLEKEVAKRQEEMTKQDNLKEAVRRAEAVLGQAQKKRNMGELKQARKKIRRKKLKQTRAVKKM